MPNFYTYGDVDDNLFNELITTMRKFHERFVMKDPWITLSQLKVFIGAFPNDFDKIVEILKYTRFIEPDQTNNRLQLTDLGLATIVEYNKLKDEGKL
ncbi:MAG: hypothetical protein R2685_07935 [Candidatus Nitrosocosmicus sp.]|jgi:IS1 family transposase|nr:hypothetical protein [Candidatus Nitrosocosmicus sp.]